jgi:hypothetical protein
MRESYNEGLANHIGPESCAGVGNGTGEALTGERASWVLSSESLRSDLGASVILTCEGQHCVHRVYDVDRLRRAYYSLKRKSAPGVDGETWQHYGENLEANLQSLSQRLQRGAYRVTGHSYRDRRA